MFLFTFMYPLYCLRTEAQDVGIITDQVVD